jgi:hypothetical protein
MYKGSYFSTSSPMLVHIWHSDYSHPSELKVTSHYGFDFHFPDTWWFLMFFYCSIVLFCVDIPLTNKAILTVFLKTYLKFIIFLNTNNAVLLHLQFWKINWASKPPYPFCPVYLGLVYLSGYLYFFQNFRVVQKGTEDTQKVDWGNALNFSNTENSSHSTFVSQPPCCLPQVWYLGGFNIQKKLNILY